MATNYGIFNRDNAGEHARAPLSLTVSGAGSPKGSSPKEGVHGGHCLCSPTTHPGSFRCRFHRSGSMGRMHRSNSMPAGKPVVASPTTAGEGSITGQNPIGNTA